MSQPTNPAIFLNTCPALPAHHHENDNMMGARSDGEAMTLFLNKSGARSEETLRRYEREITRLTAFLYIELRVGYKDVRLKHLQAYVNFIQNLPQRWLMPGVLPGQPDRIMFKSHIKSGKSTDQVIDVLSSFFSFLEKNRYTSGNPAASLIRSGEKVARGSTVIRYFYDNEWQFIKECLASLPMSTERERLESARTRLILSLSYGLALRESELTGHTCSDIHPDNDRGFYLSILGKGRKRRQVPINEALQQQIIEYRYMNGFSGLHGDNFPLAPKTRKNNGLIASLSARGLRYWWQSFMDDCQRKASPDIRGRLQGLPFHTLRHTALTHLSRKMDIEDLAIFAGHDSINTTSQYYHAEASRLKKMAADHHI
ncbi:tyrosine-type recombinase/integrase [Endozoicomonas sp. SCSIO W0465]|uniref:tyrosine-type recombinase/integrase n=1 Tax=Endozoicomonas sp. SCSIO W0465 TaxID=2918516 RepID=UPI002075F64E|nr:tyrosine-type recombinase/integrase [Endozoicomonas sp. SCSIO W0465]USE39459.1 tyrosine-type recombinase/integrase [Endozoicomonas sp. SCSIO W0465]